MAIVIFIAVISLLIFVNAFYVAAEFSAVSARRPRLAQLAEEGNPLAGYVLEVVEVPNRLDTYIAACQVGITVSSLALGYYGQAQLLALLSPLFDNLQPGVRILASSISAIAVLLSLTILQVILGELLPKNVGILHPERLAVLTAPGMRWSIRMLRPLIWLFNGSGTLVLRLIGADASSEHAHVHSPAEIEILVEESSAGGVLDNEERRLLVNTLRLRNLTVHRVMIPRNGMLAAPVSSTCEGLFSLLANSPFSRLPLYADTIDSVVGAVHLKDLMRAVYQEKAAAVSPRDCMHPVLHIPEAADVEEVMSLMQSERHNLAIVVDEYGGTAGMITLEDLIEEIVGEFHDEFDIESPAVELLPDGRLRVRGDVPIDDISDLLDLNLPSAAADTVGGLVLGSLGRIPKSGETVLAGDVPIRVDRIVGNRVVYVSIPITDEQAALLEDRRRDI